MELGAFSYYPDWDDERAKKAKVLNRTMMLDLLTAGESPFVAISGYGLSIRCPEVSELTAAEQNELFSALREGYRVVREEPYFGQAHTTLRLFERRSATP